jgi:hypothetical protein
LKNWALVASIITIRFMVDQHPSLFEALAWVNNNTFPFQQHLKVACDIVPPLVRTCFLSFEQLIEQQMVQLQDSIRYMKPIVFEFCHVLAPRQVFGLQFDQSS